MNGHRAASHDLDDAAFRARLAPLAVEVLPPVRSIAPRLPGRKSAVRVLAAAGLSAAAIVAVIWFYPPSPSLGPEVIRLGTARVDEPPAPPAVSAPPLAAAPVPEPAGDMVDLLSRRGNAAASAGDIAGARLLFERAATLGSAAAATAVGKTYDIAFLLEAGARGIAADHAAAAIWYRKGAAMGDVEARERLAKLEAAARR